MVRKAQKDDISRIAEILVFAKRTAYRSIFQNDEVSGFAFCGDKKTEAGTSEFLFKYIKSI